MREHAASPDFCKDMLRIGEGESTKKAAEGRKTTLKPEDKP